MRLSEKVKKIAVVTLKDGRVLRGQLKDKGAYYELKRVINGIESVQRIEKREILKIELKEPINAIRAKRPRRLPTVLTKNEVRDVIRACPVLIN